MNIIALYSLMALTIIRIIALGVSTDFFYFNRKRGFIFFIIGWISWAIASLLLIIGALYYNAFFLEDIIFINSIFAALAGFYLLLGVFSYFMEIKPKFILLISLLIILIPLVLLLFFGKAIGSIFASTVLIISVVSIFLILVIKFEPLKERLGSSIRWYYITGLFLSIYLPLTFYTTFQLGSVGIYTSSNTIFLMLYWLPGLISTILIVIFLIHLEYNINFKQKNKLKDLYSHNLANVLQALDLANKLIINKVNANKDEKLIEVIDIFNEKIKESSDIINEIRKL